ncbi:hypothetical protein ABFT23_12295 [Nocardioides sp. C4-1]|uniref:hypothetical protein n=1 Tax=Nocardioides sp. C4-1 TaxID=3151851 RepID=UPI0032644CB8
MNPTSQPLRRLALLAATAATAAALTPVTASAAPPSGPPAPTGADLPQVAQVDDTFGYLAGGRRMTSRSNRLEVADESCLSYGSGVPAKARFASYATADGDQGYFQGEEDPTFVVYQFATTARARAGYALIADYVNRCQGRTSDDGYRKTVDTVRVPRLGQRQVGFRTVAVESGDRREDLEVYVLKGSRIERSWIQLDEGRARRAHVVAMARLLTRTAR